MMPLLRYGFRPFFAGSGLAAVLLTAAALVRVFGLAILRIAYPEIILLAAFLWTAPFVLFIWIYAPMLPAPRVDGKPG